MSTREVQTWVVLLRGVNVGGKMLSMPSLRSSLLQRGYLEVTTYIQSGNVILLSERVERETLQQDVEQLIGGDFGLTVTVLTRTPGELAATVRNNPFAKPGVDPKTLHVTFLATPPDPETLARIDRTAARPDEFAIHGRDIYLHCPDGYGRSMLGNPFWEKTLRLRATTRNWRTVNRLLEMSRRPE